MAGYSGATLAKKLGIKPGMKACLYNPTKSALADLKSALADVTSVAAFEPELDFVLAFARSQSELKQNVGIWKKSLSRSGSLWIAWPKKTSGLETDLADGVVREIGLNAGLVDVKVCAIDEQWSGLKFVYRKRDR